MRGTKNDDVRATNFIGLWTKRVYLPLIRYASSFRGVLDVDRALSCSSLRDFEETLHCSSAKCQQSCPGLAPSVAWQLGERAFPAEDWSGYWQRNEPLRDADEVAVPLLCVCSRDDPLLPLASTLPLSLFQSNPYFLLALTDRGGHCGFTLEGGRSRGEEVSNWSHMVVLEYFKVVGDFLRGEGKEGLSRGGSPGESSQAWMRSRAGNVAQPRRRRGSVVRRMRTQGFGQSSEHREEEEFTWKRSYTR